MGLCMSHRGALWGQVTAASQPHSPYDPITTTVPSHCHPITYIHMPQSLSHPISHFVFIAHPISIPSYPSHNHIPNPSHICILISHPLSISHPISYPQSIPSHIHTPKSHVLYPYHPTSIPNSRPHIPSQIHPIPNSSRVHIPYPYQYPMPIYISFCHIPSRIQIPTRSPCILPPLPGGAHYIPAALSHKGQLLHLASPACLS